MKYKKLTDRIKIVLQKDESDCGPACLLSLIRFHEGTESLENIRILTGCTNLGTTMLGLQQAAQSIGFTAAGYRAGIQELLSLSSPCILHTIENRSPHFVIFFGIFSKRQNEIAFIIGDPARGILLLSESELLDIWLNNFCLILEPTSLFIKEKEIKKQKAKWIYRITKPDVDIFLVAFGLGIMIAMLNVSMALFSQKLIDDILPNKNLTKLIVGVSIICFLLLTKEALLYFRSRLLSDQSKQLSSRLIDSFLSSLLNVPKLFFDTRNTGDFVARLNDTSRIQRIITQLIGNATIDFLITALSLGFVFYFSWRVGILFLIAIPFFSIYILRKNRALTQVQKDVMISYAKVESSYISTLHAIEVIKGYRKENLFKNLNLSVFNYFQQKIFKTSLLQAKITFSINSINVIFLCLIIVEISTQVFYHQLRIGEFVAILNLIGVLIPGIANLALIAIPITEAKIAIERMFELLLPKFENSVIGESEIPEFEKLEIQSLSYRFPGSKKILSDISLKIQKGEIVGIIGENGAGKSTLIQVLQKHYKQESGEVLLNETIKISEIDLYSWQKCLGVVSQNIHLFNCSILENIAFEDAVAKPDEVVQFLTDSGLLKYFQGFPQSYNTLVGNAGINLSGGQKQFIAITRALYHKPQLLVLDEATSAMDRDSEKIILTLILNLQSKLNLSVLFITHKLHILKTICNYIYVLKNGVVSHHGTHNQLLLSNNLYSNFWDDLKRDVT